MSKSFGQKIIGRQPIKKTDPVFGSRVNRRMSLMDLRAEYVSHVCMYVCAELIRLDGSLWYVKRVF